MFEDKGIGSSALGLFSDELFLPWIQKIHACLPRAKRDGKQFNYT